MYRSLLFMFSEADCTGPSLMWEFPPESCLQLGSGDGVKYYVKATCTPGKELKRFVDNTCTTEAASELQFGPAGTCSNFPNFFPDGAFKFDCHSPVITALDLNVNSSINELHQEADGSDGGATIGLIFGIFAGIIFLSCATYFVLDKVRKKQPAQKEEPTFDEGPAIAGPP